MDFQDLIWDMSIFYTMQLWYMYCRVFCVMLTIFINIIFII